MQHYLQQCLVYHEEQEEVRRNQVAAVPLAETETQFVPSSVKIETDESEPFHLQEEAPIAFKNATAQLIPNTSLVKQAEEGRLRVQAILQRFQHQQEKLFQAHPLVAAAANVDANGDECRHNEDGIIDGEPLSIYREQRIAGLQREETRKHAALLKNLEYVAARENERYQQLMVQAKKTRQHQQHIHDRSQNVLEERKRAQFAAGTKLKSQRGVGAGRRTTIDSVKQAKTHAPGGQQQEEREQSSVAIYLSGIPTNDTVGDGMLRQLFSSYGKILKLHFYRNKKTGQLKGDGLIVYQVSSKERGNDLIQLVRSQVSKGNNTLGSSRHAALYLT
jgi:hypothetical protein